MSSRNDWFFELFEDQKIKIPELELEEDELPSMPLEAKHRAESLHRARVLLGVAAGTVIVAKVLTKRLDKPKHRA